jgi:hypothetical protein
VGTIDYDIDDPDLQEGSFTKRWVPYEQDMTHYPEVFKMYQENYAKYDKVEKRIRTDDPFEEEGGNPFKRQPVKDMSPWEKKYDDLMPRYTGTSC